VWDEFYVTYYQQDPDSLEYKIDGKPASHMKTKEMYGEEVRSEGALSWGVVPFIPLQNNDEGLYDLQPVKGFIDVYDLVDSDFANNLEDIQDIYWILKGYNGENMDTFLAEVRKYKTLKVSEEGDAKAQTVEIPTEARKTMLEILNDDIFKFGRGVDTSKTGEGTITNVVIKSRFANLDLKASEFENQLRDFIDRVVVFYNRYLNIKGQPLIEDYDVTFNRSQIFNETEILKANAEQQGAVSEDTRLSNHPWVDNVEEEKKKLEAEKPVIVLTDDEDGEEDPTGGDGGGQEG
jgi:SPP1 family phage portal protein